MFLFLAHSILLQHFVLKRLNNSVNYFVYVYDLAKHIALLFEDTTQTESQQLKVPVQHDIVILNIG